MYNIKGFLSITPFCKNTPGLVSPLGELTPQSLTYAKDVGIYGKKTNTDVVFYSFSSVDDTGAIIIPTTFADHITTIGQWVAAYSVFGGFRNDAVAAIRDISTTNPSMGEVEVGAMIHKVDGATDIWMPEWISWKFLTPGTANRIKIWLSDNSFQNQYDLYKIEIVPPVVNIDDLFDDRLRVQALLDAQTVPVLMDRINAKASEKPYTALRSETFDWVEPGVEASKIGLSWTTLIYGEAGNNIDAVKDALIAFILANSTHTRDEWAALLPDLFKATEFIITPFWDEYSVPNKTLQAGVYSPTVDYKRALVVAKLTAPGYTPLHVETKLAISAAVYKSLCMAVVGGPENRGGINTFKGILPDYMAVPTTNMDFDRMAPTTQEWVMMLTRMLIAAESLTEFSDVPAGLTRMKRDGVLYVVTNYKKIQWLVVAKSQFEVINVVAPNPSMLTNSEGDSLTNNSGTPLGN